MKIKKDINGPYQMVKISSIRPGDLLDNMKIEEVHVPLL